MQTFEKLSDYKRAVKTFIRGTIKSKIFALDTGKLIFHVLREDCDGNVIMISAHNEEYETAFEADVTTRIDHKINQEFFEPIIAQFGKLKGFGGMEVVFDLN